MAFVRVYYVLYRVPSPALSKRLTSLGAMQKLISLNLYNSFWVDTPSPATLDLLSTLCLVGKFNPMFTDPSFLQCLPNYILLWALNHDLLNRIFGAATDQVTNAGRTCTGLLQFVCQRLRTDVKKLETGNFSNGLVTGSGLVLDLNLWHFARFRSCLFSTLLVSQQGPERLATFDYSVNKDVTRHAAFGERVAIVGGFPIEDGVGEQGIQFH